MIATASIKRRQALFSLSLMVWKTTYFSQGYKISQRQSKHSESNNLLIDLCKVHWQKWKEESQQIFCLSALPVPMEIRLEFLVILKYYHLQRARTAQSWGPRSGVKCSSPFQLFVKNEKKMIQEFFPLEHFVRMLKCKAVEPWISMGDKS